MKRTLRAFTLIEIMITVGILAMLLSILLVTVGKVRQAARSSQTQQTIQLVGASVEGFRSSTKEDDRDPGLLPLAMTYDAWTTDASWGDFINHQTQNGKNFPLADYFSGAATNVRPRFLWGENANGAQNPRPTNSHMLTAQLMQTSDSDKVLNQIRSTLGKSQENLKYYDGTVREWKSLLSIAAGDGCRIRRALDQLLTEDKDNWPITFQIQDAFGMPIRYWTQGTLKWAKDTSGGNWNAKVVSYLAEKIQASGSGYFIESAGPDGKFGWEDDGKEPTTMEKDITDNIVSGKN